MFIHQVRWYLAYSNEKPGVPTETPGVYLEPQGVQVGRLAGMLRDVEMVRHRSFT